MARQGSLALVRIYGDTGVEKYTLLLNRLTPRNGTAPGAIYCHGAEADNTSVIFHPTALQLAYRGFLVMGIDAGGIHTWGNDLAMTRISSGKTWLQDPTKGGAAAGKIVMLGGSMGSVNALCWSRANVASLWCTQVALPIPDLEAARAADRFGFASDIEAAYGGNAAWQAARPTHNPIEFVSDITNLPIRLDTSSTDTAGLPAETEAFHAALGSDNSTLVYFGAAGHSYTGWDGKASADWVNALVP